MTFRTYLRRWLVEKLLDLAAYIEPEPETVDDLMGNSPVVGVHVYRVDTDDKVGNLIDRLTEAARERADRQQWN